MTPPPGGGLPDCPHRTPLGPALLACACLPGVRLPGPDNPLCPCAACARAWPDGQPPASAAAGPPVLRALAAATAVGAVGAVAGLAAGAAAGDRPPSCC